MKKLHYLLLAVVVIGLCVLSILRLQNAQPPVEPSVAPKKPQESVSSKNVLEVRFTPAIGDSSTQTYQKPIKTRN